MTPPGKPVTVSEAPPGSLLEDAAHYAGTHHHGSGAARELASSRQESRAETALYRLGPRRGGGSLFPGLVPLRLCRQVGLALRIYERARAGRVFFNARARVRARRLLARLPDSARCRARPVGSVG